MVWVSPDFEGGGFVAAGEPLVRMDPAAFELAVAAAQAAVEGAEAQVWLEEALGEENEREFLLADPEGTPSAWVRREPHAALAQAQLKRAQAELALAELQLARTEISLPLRRARGDGGGIGGPVGASRGHRCSDLPGGRLPSGDPAGGGADGAQGSGLPGAGRGPCGAGDGPDGRLDRGSDPDFPGGQRCLAAGDGVHRVCGDGGPGTAAAAGDVRGGCHRGTGPVGCVCAAAHGAAGGRGRLGGAGRPVGAVRAGGPRWIPEGWVVSAFDAGEGVVTGALPGARAGLEVSAQAVESP